MEPLHEEVARAFVETRHKEVWQQRLALVEDKSGVDLSNSPLKVALQLMVRHRRFVYAGPGVSKEVNL